MPGTRLPSRTSPAAAYSRKRASVKAYARRAVTPASGDAEAPASMPRWRAEPGVAEELPPRGGLHLEGDQRVADGGGVGRQLPGAPRAQPPLGAGLVRHGALRVQLRVEAARAVGAVRQFRGGGRLEGGGGVGVQRHAPRRGEDQPSVGLHAPMVREPESSGFAAVAGRRSSTAKRKRS